MIAQANPPFIPKAPERHGERATGLRRVHLVLERGIIFHELTHYLDKEKKEHFYTCSLTGQTHHFEPPRDWSHHAIEEGQVERGRNGSYYRYADPPHINGAESVEILDYTSDEPEIIYCGPWPGFEAEFGRIFDTGRNVQVRTKRDYVR